MRKKNKSNRHRSNGIGNYMAKHYIDNGIHVQSSGTITNFTAASGRVNVHFTPQYHSSAQQLNANVEKTYGHADAFNNQTAGTPKQHQTAINHDNSCLVDYLSSAAPYVVLAAAALVVSSIIKERA